MRLRALACLAMLTTGSFLAFGETRVAAQSHLITADDTLGAEGSTVTTVAPLVDLIGGGVLRDEHLFHSFEEFNIGEGWTANFANPDGVFSILSRVTGKNPSNLFGTLGVLGDADLFFINPNGVLFGPDASLDIPGSLMISTADGLVLPDGSVYSATNPGVPQLLEIDVDVPIGVRFDDELAAALGNEALLEVGENLTLSAGDVESTGVLFAPNGDVLVEGIGDVRVQDMAAQSAVLSAGENLVLEESRLQTTGDLSLLAGNTVRVRDSEENPFWAVARGDLLVRGDELVDILALNHLEITPFQSGGNLTLMSGGEVSGDAHFHSNGSFSILNLSEGINDFISLYDPVIFAKGNVSFGDYTGPALLVRATGSIIGGKISITGNDSSPREVCNLLGCSTDVQEDVEDLANSPAVILRSGLPPGELGDFPLLPILVLPIFRPDLANTIFNIPPPAASVGMADFGIISDTDIPKTQVPPGTANLPPGSIQIASIDTIPNDVDFVGPIGGLGKVVLESQTGNVEVTQDNAFPNEGFSIGGASITIDALERVYVRGGITARINNSSSSGNISIGENSRIRQGVTVGSLSTRQGGTANGGNIVVKTEGSFETTGAFNRAQGSVAVSDVRDPSTAAHIDFNQTVNRSPNNFASIATQSIRGNGGIIEIEANDGIEIHSGELVSVDLVNGITIQGEIVSANDNTGLGDPLPSNNGRNSDGGKIELTASSGFIEVGNVRSFTESSLGQAGQVIINALNNITTRDISTTSIDGPFVDFMGDIDITSELGTVDTTGGTLNSSTQGGQAGDVRLRAGTDILTGDIFSRSVTGESDDIFLVSENGNIDTSQGTLAASTDSGTAGDIILEANSGKIIVDEIFSISTTGQSGSIELESNVNAATIADGVGISIIGGNLRTTTSQGTVGNISLQARDNISILRTEINSNITEPESSSDTVGLIELISNDGKVVIEDGSAIVATTAGKTQASSIILDASDIEISNNSLLNASTFGPGEGGNVTLVADGDGVISITDSDIQVNSLTGGGNTGRIEFQAPEGVVALENSDISASLFQGSNASRQETSIDITAGSLLVSQGSRIASLTLATGDAGNIDIDFIDEFIVSGNNPLGQPSGLVASSEDNAIGSGGDITVNSVTPQGLMRIADGGFLSVRTRSNNRDNKGGGNIQVNVNELSLLRGGQFVSSSAGNGDAGEIVITAIDKITISGRNLDFDDEAIDAKPLGGTGLINEDETGVDSDLDIVPDDFGDSAESPQSIDMREFSIEPRGDIANSAIFPHISIDSASSDNNETADYYSIEISTPGSLGIFDIDGGFSAEDGATSSVRTQLFVFREDSDFRSSGTSDGRRVLPEYQTAPGQVVPIPGAVDIGSELDPTTKASPPQTFGYIAAVVPDPLLSYEFSEEGTYIVAVEKVDESFKGEEPLLLPTNGPTNEQNYTLHISIGDPDLDPIRNFNPVQGENSGLFAQSQGLSSSDNITINTNQLTVEQGGQIATSTELGSAGSVLINSIEGIDPASKIALESGSIIAQAQNSPDDLSIDNSNSRAGNVTINAFEIELANGSEISTNNEGSQVPVNEREKFGNILLQNLETLTVDNSLISTSTETGDAGNVTVNASDSISIRGRISPEASAEVEGLMIDEDGINRGGILAVAGGEDGEAGNVAVQTTSLDIDDKAVIAVSSESGEAGIINIEANNIDLTRGASIRSETSDDGSNPDSGDINITLNGFEPIFWLRYGERDFAEINASGLGDATGGTITIGVDDDAGFVIAVPSEDSDIITTAERGDGGRVLFGEPRVNFTGRTFVLGLRERPEDTFLSDVVVKSDQGSAGLVGFSDPINEGFFELEEELLLPSSPNLDEGCQIGARERQAEFFDYGLGGAPPGPDELMGGGNILTDWIPLDLADPNRRPIDLDTFVTAPTISNTASVSHSMNLLSLCTADEDE